MALHGLQNNQTFSDEISGRLKVIACLERPKGMRISFFFDVVNSCSGQRIYPPNYAGSIWPAARRCHIPWKATKIGARRACQDKKSRHTG